jgi:hypothetical protein
MILDFLNENIPWRNSNHYVDNPSPLIDSVKDEVKDIKMKVLSHPDKFLWSSSTKEFPQIKTIFNHIKGL